MIIGIYFFIACVIVGYKINQNHHESIERMDKDSCCESRTLVPEGLFAYMVFMIRSGLSQRLGIFLIVGFILYALFFFLTSWLVGLVLFRSTEDPGKVLGYGFALNLIFELVIFFILTIYWLTKLVTESFRKMKDYDAVLSKHLHDNDEEQGRDRTASMADHLSLYSK